MPTVNPLFFNSKSLIANEGKFARRMFLYSGAIAEANGLRSRMGVDSYAVEVVNINRATGVRSAMFAMWYDELSGRARVRYEFDDPGVNRPATMLKTDWSADLTSFSDEGLRGYHRFSEMSPAAFLRLTHLLHQLHRWFREQSSSRAMTEKWGWTDDDCVCFLNMLSTTVSTFSWISWARMTEEGGDAQIYGMRPCAIGRNGRVVPGEAGGPESVFANVKFGRKSGVVGWRVATASANGNIYGERLTVAVHYDGEGRPDRVLSLDDDHEFFSDREEWVFRGRREKAGAVSSTEAALWIAVSGEAARIFHLSEGTRYAVSLVERHGDRQYYCVRNDDGDEAWLSESRVAEVG